MCGGDMPWSRRVAGISTASQVGSLHNEAVRVAGEWVGAGQRRTLQRQAAHLKRHTEGARCCEVAGCTTKPLLLLAFACIVECILHLAMAMGRLLATWVQAEGQKVPPTTRGRLQAVLLAHKTGLCLKGSTSLDGEDSFRLFGAWEDICDVLAPAANVAEAIGDMGALLRTLYVTYQSPLKAPPCAKVAKAFREAICPTSGSQYLLFLEQDCEQLLEDIYPYGMAMFSGDVVEGFNRLLKQAFNDHSNRGGGKVSEGLQGLIDSKGAVLRQVWEWVFLYFDIPLQRHGEPRNHPIRAQTFCEGTVLPAQTPPRTTSRDHPPPTPLDTVLGGGRGTHRLAGPHH